MNELNGLNSRVLKMISIAIRNLILVSFVFAFYPNTTAQAQILRAFAEPVRISEVAASESGVVCILRAREGDHVRQGDVLAELDKGVVEKTLEAARAKAKSTARVDAATAMLEIRQQQYENYLELDSQGHGNKFEVERAKAELNAAEADHRLALEEQRQTQIEVLRIAAQLERRIVRSPFDGIVTQVHKEVGEFVSSAEPQLVTVVKLDQLRAKFYLKATQVEKLSKGQAVRVLFIRAGQRLYSHGKVEFVSPVVEPKSGTAQVDVIIDNKENRFISGGECLWEEVEHPGRMP